MDPLAALVSRRSTPSRLLGEPGPGPAELARILAAAVRVPDHGRLAPWRFLRIGGESRHRLGELLAARAVEKDPATPEALLVKDRARFSHAPLVIAVVASPRLDQKVPEIEQLLSGGALCLNLLQAAQALGYAGQWLTGWAAYDPVILARLGLAGHERLLGFIHLGTAREPVPERERPDAMARLEDLAL